MMLRFVLAGCLMPAFTAHALDFDSQKMLAAHNRWRAAAHVPVLSYSPELAASAQEWANSLKDNNHCQMQHSKPAGRYGENLFWASALKWSDGKRELQKVTPNKVVDDWGSERADYNYQNNSCAGGKMCGHYTQLVWRSTTTVGCAVAVCDGTREQIWVCQYQPPGNWVGEKPF